MDPKPSRKQKLKEPQSNPATNGAERLKTVVRRLPPNLPEEIFWQSVQAWVTDDTVTWKAYHPGKLRTKRVNKESVPSRAYIAFKNEELIATFSREYNGHLFRDKAGNESHAIVEFAPFQKVPAEKKKVDARNNTIDKDEDYLSFLDTLKNTPKTESVSLETLIAAAQPPPPPTTTPLLEALKAEKLAQKDKETILRNHAHYKDTAASGAPSKKEEGKKKAAMGVAPAAAAVQPAKQPETLVPPSKKAKKAAAAAAVAAQKASAMQAQEGQGPPSKSPSSAKFLAPASSAAYTPRHRGPKEPHGRPQTSKGDASAPAPPSVSLSVSTSGPGPAPPADNAPSSPAPSSAQAHSQRKPRPVIGLGRQFEAALNGTGVAVGPAPNNDRGDRKKRDKGGSESGGGGGGGGGPGTAPVATEGGAAKGKHRHREGGAPPSVVPSILQRPDVGGGASVTPDVGMVQRPTSPRGTEGPGHGSARRGKGRRGGHRGG